MLIKILTIAQVVVALALIVVVLLQHGKQQGLSGAIAGGAETFFGKNKGRTVDNMLKKFTSVVAILFIALSLTLTFMTGRQAKLDNAETDGTEVTDTNGEAEAAPIPIQISDDKTAILSNGGVTDAEGTALTMNDNGDLVYEDGTVYATGEEFQNAMQQLQPTEGAENAEGGEASAAPEAE